MPPDGEGRPRLVTADGPNAYSAIITTTRIAPDPGAAADISDLPPGIAARTTVHECGCWRCSINLDRNGYSRIGGKGTHRLVYALLVGAIPEGLVLDHVKARGCLFTNCIFPGHLEPVPPRINVLRGTSFAAINAAKDVCDSGHEFDLYNTYWRPNGHRDCRTCIRTRVAKYQRRIRAGGELRLAA